MESAVDYIEDLIENNGFIRSTEEQQLIIKTGRPTPELLEVLTAQGDNSRYFMSETYNRYPWLCGSAKRQKVFCWDCLLYSTQRGTWNKTGVSNLGLSKFYAAAKTHENSLQHLEAAAKFHMAQKLGLEPPSPIAESVDCLEHNKKVTRNRHVLKRFIDVLIWFLQHTSLLGTGKVDGNPLTEDARFKSFLNLLGESDVVLQLHLEQDTVKRNYTIEKDVQSDLILSLVDVVVEEICQEVEKAYFLTLLLEGTVVAGKPSRIGLTLRYVKDCQVVERFIGCSIVRSENLIDDLVYVTKDGVNSFSCADKIVGIACNLQLPGALNLEDFSSKLKKAVPSLFSLHQCHYDLAKVIMQGLRKESKCIVFICIIEGIATVVADLWKSSAFTSVIQEMLPQWCDTHQYFSSELVKSVFNNIGNLLKVFSIALENAKELKSTILVEISAFIYHLQHFDFNFLLGTTNEIFAVLAQLPSHQSASRLVGGEVVHQYFTQLHNRFDYIYKRTLDRVEEPKLSSQFTLNHKQEFQRFYKDILDNVQLVCQDYFNFKISKEGDILMLVDTANFSRFTAHFPESAFLVVKECVSKSLDFERLRNELEVIYKLPLWTQLDGGVNVLSVLQSTQLWKSFQEFHKLACLAFSLPSNPGDIDVNNNVKIADYNLSKLEDIENLSFLMLSLNQDYVLSLSCQGDLHEKITEKFVQRSNNANLSYR